MTRYSNTFGRPYRYLCGRCRKQELADETAELDQATGVTRQPGESTSSLLMRRLAALAEQYTADQSATGSSTSRQPPGGVVTREPTDEEWGEHVDRLTDLLAVLDWAGWQVPDAYDCDFDAEHGPLLCGTLRRTWMVIEIEYDPARGQLQLHPFDDLGDEDELAHSMLEDTVTVALTGDRDSDVQAVAAIAGELGLLDATRLHHAGGGEQLAELMNLAYAEYFLAPAQAYRDMDRRALADELDSDEFFSMFFRFVVGLAGGGGVLPDLVPDAAALGVVAWCWRNNTAVEDWHLPSDVLMARVNIAATRAVQPHIDPYEGVDWDAVQAALTDPAWRLPGGAIVAELFGEGWPEVTRTVGEQVQVWKRLDEVLIGPEATLRLLTVGGSTSYTDV